MNLSKRGAARLLQASKLGIRIATRETLRKYGLDLEEWLKYLADVDYRCPICMRRPSTGRMVIDHEHVPGYAKLAPEERRKYVRGLTCWTCNRFLLARDMTLAVAERIVLYLRAYLDRKASG